MKIWFNPEGKKDNRPTYWNNAQNPRDEDLFADGWKCLDAPDCDEKYWVHEGDGFREMLPVEKSALAEKEAQAAEQAQADRIAVIPQSLWETAAGFLVVYHRHFGVGAETNREITIDVVRKYFAVKAVTPCETAGQDALDLRLLEDGYKAITTWTGTNEIWSFPWAQLPEIK